MEARPAQDLKVGATFMIALVVLIFAYFFIERLNPFQRGYMMYVVFDRVAGLPVGSEVRWNGINVGEVKGRDPDKPYNANRIRVAVLVKRRDVEIRKTDRYEIKTNLLTGQSNLEISSPKDSTGPLIGPGTRITTGQSPAETADVIPKVSKLLDTINEAAEGINHLITAGPLKESLDKTAVNIEKTSAEALKMVSALSGVTRGSTEDIRAMIRQLRETSDSIKKTAAAVEQMASDPAVKEHLEGTLAAVHKTAENVASLTGDEKLRENLTEAVAAIRGAADNIQKLSGGEDVAVAASNIRQATEQLNTASKKLAETVSDPKLREALDASLDAVKAAAKTLEESASSGAINRAVANLEQVTQSLRTSAQEVENILVAKGGSENISATLASFKQAAADIEKTADHLQGLLTSPEMSEDIRGAVHDIRRASAGAAEVTAEAKELLARGGSALAGLRGVRVGTEGGVRFVAGPDVWKTGTSFSFDLRNRRTLELGADDIGVRTLGIGLVGAPLNPRTRVVGGLYRSELGVGLSHRLGRSGTEMETYLFDPNSPRMDARLHVPIASDLRITFGAEDIFKGTHLLYGVTYGR